jgi:hypothetical protein
MHLFGHSRDYDYSRELPREGGDFPQRTFALARRLEASGRRLTGMYRPVCSSSSGKGRDRLVSAFETAMPQRAKRTLGPKTAMNAIAMAQATAINTQLL